MLAFMAILSCLLFISEARIELLNSKYMGKVSHNVKANGVMPLRTVAGRAGDSNTYFVKLPPSQHYYSALSSKVPYSPNGKISLPLNQNANNE